MYKEVLISCFQDTLKLSKEGKLKSKTKQFQRSNTVYKEGFISTVPKRKENGSVIIEAGSTFAVSRQYCHLGKIAVLNFANPENPGGGVQLGAMAQEECLCRSSNLYPCLSDTNVFEDYYAYHRNCTNHFYSDRLIYTKDITVFKDDGDVPQMMPSQEWFTVDVITCAAPYLAKRKYTNLAALLTLFKRRIKNIIEAARDNHVDVIVLGAFGCGAFRNPPLIVAEAFKEVILEEDYLSCFKKIVFAIKSTTPNDVNWFVFQERLRNIIFDELESCSVLSMPFEWRFDRIPAFLERISWFDHSAFSSWQRKNRYFGKEFSVLGDSISTLEGYNPRGYKVFYTGGNCVNSGVMQMEDTWWDKVIGFFGGELLVNNSWSGSRVTKLPTSTALFPSGCSDERTSALHINDVKPDVIIVYLGTNDWAFGAKLGNENFQLMYEESEIFMLAYNNMLKKLKRNYPQSEIWCCTLSETHISEREDFIFPHKYAGIHIEEYNEIIRRESVQNNCKLIDIYSYKMPYDSVDGSHPTSEGMTTIVTAVIREILGENADPFLNCENEQHNFAVAEVYTGGTKYVCQKCGKIKNDNVFPTKECSENDQDYGMYGQSGDYDFYRSKKCEKESVCMGRHGYGAG